MKVNYIYLENFVNVYAGLGKRKIEIDFSKSKNSKILLLGDNGSGKSVLLSCLQPYRDTNDSRDMEVLSDEKKAIKIIKIEDNGNLYEIKHTYGNNSSMNKSFIKKNGVDLNESGSIRSFNTIVESELGITKDYFVLGRLGDNVNNFIDQSMTDRKKYINKFIPDISRFLNSHKIVSDKLLLIDRQIKTINVSLEKYGSLEENQIEINRLTETLDTLEKTKNELENEYNLDLYKIEELNKNKEEIISLINEEEFNPYNLDNFEDILDRANLELINLTREVKTYKESYQELDNMSLDKKKIFKDNLKERLYKSQLDLNNINNSLNNIDKELNGYKSNLSSLERNINSIGYIDDSGIDEKYEILKSKREETNKSIESISGIYNNEDKYETSDLLLSKLDSLRENFGNLRSNIDNNLIEFIISNNGVNESYQFLENNLNSYKKELSEKEEELKELNIEYNRINKESSLLEILEHSENHEHTKDCPFVPMALNFKNNEFNNLSEMEDKGKALEIRISELNRMIPEVVNNINTFNNYIKQFKFSIIKIYTDNDRIFNLYNIGIEDFERLVTSDNIPFFDQLKEEADTYSLLKTYKEELSVLDNKIHEIEMSKKSLELLNDFLSQKKIIEDNISNIYPKIENLNNKKKLKNEEILALEDSISVVDSLIEFNSKEEKLKSIVKFSSENNDKLIKLENEIQELEIKVNQFKEKIISINVNINGNKEQLEKYKKEYYLIKESIDNLNKINAVRGIFKDIKDSLDPKKGIPLIFSKNYLISIAERANDLLDVAYKGNYQIRFDIDSRDFKIAVIKNDGNDLEDISFASQGETSMTSISLSLSMLGSMMSDLGKYNIIYLDEMDAQLDNNNRRSYINVLERQMEVLDIEQAFIITHNNEFYSYDVDLILLNGYETKIDITDKSIMEGKKILYKNY